jgi:UDP:flavonoid glycosyltransferase YjiC (YdhE family)
MRVLLSTHGSRGDVEPMAGLAVRLRELGAEVRVCAPPDCAERLAEVGLPPVDNVRDHVFTDHPWLRASKDAARVAAVVHHGGAGTTTTAARAGAPQVVVPQMVDQPYWAGRVADLGIGTAHDGRTPTAESLSAALRTTLTPETRARATAVAGTIRTDGTAVAAALLADAVSRERPPVPA